METDLFKVNHREYFTDDSSLLPPAIAVRRGQSIPLVEIPFETTRQEIIALYLDSVELCLAEAHFKTMSATDVMSHFLFLKSLASLALTEKERNQLLSYSASLSDVLKVLDLSLWNKASGYIQDSQFPIIGWLIQQPKPSNFITSLISSSKQGLLTRHHISFLRQFAESAAFYFPDLMYMLWVTQSFEADSNEKAMHHSARTIYYHPDITDNLLLRTPPKQFKFVHEHYYQMEKEAPGTAFRYLMAAENLVRVQGRTLLFKDEADAIIAVKVQKKGEEKSCLAEEYQMTSYLVKHQRRLNLKSKLPIPLGLYSLQRTEILQMVENIANKEQLLELIGESNSLEVYVYQAPSSYFTYLHDEQQTFAELASAVKTNIHDLFVLLKEGIVFTQLADIFHTHMDEEVREDKGRYYPLVQLLRVFQPHLGRIDRWQKAVEFVNLRASGLADLGDHLPLNHLFTPSEFTRQYFPEILTGGYHQTFVDPSSGVASSIYTGKRKLFGNYLYLNTIAEYLLVTQLTLGAYGDKVTRTLEDPCAKQAIWQQLGDLMFQSCAEAVSLMTEIPQEKALELLNQRAKIATHVQQTQFWMTPDYAKMNESEIRIHQYMLYPGESGYEVNDELVPGVGLSLDGINQDLGGYNQSLPLKELEKLLFATVTLIEGITQLDNQFFQQLVHIKEMISSHFSVDDCYQAVENLLEIARIACHSQKDLALLYYEKIKKSPSEQPHFEE